MATHEYSKLSSNLINLYHLIINSVTVQPISIETPTVYLNYTIYLNYILQIPIKPMVK